MKDLAAGWPHARRMFSRSTTGDFPESRSEQALRMPAQGDRMLKGVVVELTPLTESDGS